MQMRQTLGLHLGTRSPHIQAGNVGHLAHLGQLCTGGTREAAHMGPYVGGTCGRLDCGTRGPLLSGVDAGVIFNRQLSHNQNLVQK